MKYTVLTGLILLVIGSMFATNVSGSQSGIWTIGNSPYTITGDITVPASDSLIIEQGVIIQAAGNYQITVQGRLRAIGAIGDTIRFTSTVNWKGLRFENPTRYSIIRHCAFDHCVTSAINSITSPLIITNNHFSTCEYAINLFGVGSTNPPNILIEHNLIENCVKSGIYVAENSNTLIQFNDIRNCGTGASFYGAIHLANQSANGSCNPLIQYNRIHNNQKQGIIGWDVTSNGLVQPTIQYNTIYSNLSGIYLRHANGIIRNNIVRDNFIPGNTNSGAGIMISGASAHTKVFKNSVTGNYTGFYITEGANPILGDVNDPTTGLNYIANNIDGTNTSHSVYSLSTASILAQNNIWGTSDTTAIANSINGTVNFSPLYAGGIFSGVLTIADFNRILDTKVIATCVNDPSISVIADTYSPGFFMMPLPAGDYIIQAIADSAITQNPYVGEYITDLSAQIVTISTGLNISGQIQLQPIAQSGMMVLYIRPTIDNQSVSVGSVVSTYKNGTLCAGSGVVALDNQNTPSTFLLIGGATGFLSYKIWDAVTDSLYAVQTTGEFLPGTVAGFPPNYININYDVIPSTELNLQAGWNLISLNVHREYMSPSSIFQPIITNINQIKDLQSVYMPSQPDYLNTLHLFTDGQGYWVNVDSTRQYVVTGNAVNPLTPISLNAGWNLIGVPLSESIPVEVAFSSIISNVVTVKDLYNVYSPTNPPEMNTLTDIAPANGYWVNVTNPCTLVFPSPEPSKRVVAAVNKHIPADWTPVIHTNSTVYIASIATSCGCGIPNASIAAFVGDECRAVQTVITHDNIYYAVLVINGDTPENVTFKLYDPSTDEVTSSETTIVSSPGTTIENGALYFVVNSTDNNELQKVTTLLPNYPNPFNPSTTISFSLSSSDVVDLSIYNAKGQKVRTLINEHMKAGTYQKVWDGKDNKNSSLSSGIYFAHMQIGTKGFTQKMLMIK